MQGVLVVVLGIALMYLVLSGKLDCLIAAFRACAGSTSETTAVTPSSLPQILPDLNPKSVVNGILST